MKSWLKRIAWGLLVIGIVLGAIVYDFLRHGGQFRTLEPHFNGSCSPLPMQASAEDIQIDRARGIAYLSYLDRRGQVEGKPVLGTVMQLDLNAPEPRLQPALARDPAAFRPHGMSLYRTGDGSQRLFVISHPPGKGHTIEILEQTPGSDFTPVATLRDPLFLAPNAILAVGPNQFYVANDSGATNPLARLSELLFRRGLSAVVYHDGQSARVAAGGLKSAAGITMSPDGSRVYVSETSGNRISVFRRNTGTGDLEFLEHIEIGSAPDNLNAGVDGSIWIAAHAKVASLVRHFADATQHAPTQILRFVPAASGTGGTLDEVYLDAGSALSAGSVGAVHERQLLIGSITERRLLRCRLP